MQQRASTNSVSTSAGNDNDEVEELVFFHKDFVPRETDVIIGKGMNTYNHPGNLMLRRIVALRMNEYASVSSRKEKSAVLTSIVEEINANGSFIKKDTETGLWFAADDILSRDKTSQAIRNMLNKRSKRKSVGKKRFYTKKRKEYWGNQEVSQSNSEQEMDNANNDVSPNGRSSLIDFDSSNSFADVFDNDGGSDWPFDADDEIWREIQMDFR